MRRTALWTTALGCIMATQVWAHHSFAMFDREKKMPLSGVVKEFQWTNPHVWIQVLVPNEQGGTDEWGIECTSVNFMTRRGWSQDSLKPGDKIALMIAPLKDGSKGGSLLGVTSLNGGKLELVPEE